jgi:hypothetical protein
VENYEVGEMSGLNNLHQNMEVSYKIQVNSNSARILSWYEFQDKDQDGKTLREHLHKNGMN